MHLPSYAMPCQLTHNTVALRFSMLLDSPSNISHMMSRYSLLDALIKRLFRSFQQLLDFRTNFSNAESVARISVVAIQKCAAIYGNDITLL